MSFYKFYLFTNFLRKIFRYFFVKRDYSLSWSAELDKQSLISLAKGVSIGSYVIIKTNKNPVEIGQDTQINPFTVIYGGSGVYIGRDVMIAPHCMIAAGNHDFKQLKMPIRWARNISRGPIIIEDDVWIGANSTVLDGVTIKRGCVIGAGSVVTKNTKEYGIYAGVPAKKIGSRK